MCDGECTFERTQGSFGSWHRSPANIDLKTVLLTVQDTIGYVFVSPYIAIGTPTYSPARSSLSLYRGGRIYI